MWRRPDNRRNSGDAYTTRVSNRGIQDFPMTRNSIPPRLAGIDAKKEASEIQKPLSGDRRSRTDDPLLAKQML